MTNDFLLITTFNVLILNILRAQKSHFLTVTKSVHTGHFRASIVNFAVRSFLRQMTF